jgi:hypothetical protein
VVVVVCVAQLQLSVIVVGIDLRLGIEVVFRLGAAPVIIARHGGGYCEAA